MAVKQEESTGLLEAKIRLNPDSLVFARLADEIRKQGDIARAIDICKQGMKKYPVYATGRIILGRCYLEQGDFPAAINEFTDVCKLDRRNQAALKALADIYTKQHLPQKAGELYAVLLKNDPENKSLQHLASAIPGSGIVDEIPDFSPAEDIRPPQPSLLPQQPNLQPAGSPVPRPVGAEITDRMAMMFQEEEGAPASVDDLHETSVLSPAGGAEPETGQEVVEPFSSEIEDAETIALLEVNKPARFDGQVSGSDVSTRIDTLFGGSQVPEEATSAGPALEMPVSAPSQPEQPKQPPIPAEPQTEEDTLFMEKPAPTAPAEQDRGGIAEPPQESFDVQPPRLGDIETAGFTDQVLGATEIVDFNALPEDSGFQEHKESDIQLTADSAVVGDDVLAETQTSMAEPPFSVAEESPASSDVSAEDIGAHAGPKADETLEMSKEEENKAAPETSAAGDTQIQYTPGDKARPSAGDTTIVYSSTAGHPQGGLFIDNENLDEADIFTDTIKYSLASDVVAPKAADDAPKPASKSTDLFGEEPLFGFDEKPAPAKPGEPPAPETPASSAVDVQEQPPAKPSVPPARSSDFSDEITSADTSTIEEISGEQISGEDIVGKLDEIFPKGMEDSDAPVPSPETERRLGDTDFFEKPVGDKALDQTLAWDKNDLLSAAAVPLDPAAPPLSADTLAIDDIQETLEALPDDSGSQEVPKDFYTVAGDDTGKAAVQPEAAAGPDTAETAATPAPAQDIFMDEDIMSDTAIQPVDAEFSNAAFEPPASAPEKETLAEVTPAPSPDSAGSAKIDDLFVEQNTDVPAGKASDTVMMIPKDEKADSGEAETGYFDTEIFEDTGAVPGPAEPPASRDEADLDAPLEAQMIEDTVMEPGSMLQPASVDTPSDQAEPSADKQANHVSEAAAYSIPDHVLTPTLADIYFRQGQPQLALQIFKRLLEKNPANDKLRKRIAEIEQTIATGEAPLPPAGASAKAANAPIKPRGKPGRKKKKPSAVPKLLAGVHIKRIIRENYKTAKRKR